MDTPPSEHITAPFTAEQVSGLNAYQHSGRFHPFTCANRTTLPHSENPVDLGLLIATTDGWTCEDCEYTQDWAWAWMAETPAPGQHDWLYRATELVPAAVAANAAAHAAEPAPG